ncbi:DUF6124 family protein [Pseudomonas siliginis]|uniref:DUF6124 family protein n=1 Tax=Pseudomonas siliginis TaxID=2842346 RepID=UPI003B007300
MPLIIYSVGNPFRCTPSLTTPNQDLLANACETLASAKTIAQEFAGLVKPSQRRALPGIAHTR